MSTLIFLVRNKNFLLLFRPVARISQQGAPKTTRGATFFKYNIGCMQQPGNQTWNGGPDFKWGSGHHWTPLATALFLLYEYGRNRL